MTAVFSLFSTIQFINKDSFCSVRANLFLRSTNHSVSHLFITTALYWMQVFVFLIFYRTQALFVGPLIPLFWTSGDVCPGLQSQGGFPRLRASSPVHNGFLRFTSGATPAFSTNRGVHCISVYKAWLARLLSHASLWGKPIRVPLLIESVLSSNVSVMRLSRQK